MKREIWIDNAKGICILLVILGHIVPADSIINKYIYSFHMPVFFFLSGYLFNDNLNILTFTSKKIDSIIKPYLKTCLFYIILNTFIIPIDYNIKESIKNIILGNYVNLQYINGHLWFLVCLFISQLLLYMICKISKNNKVFFLNIVILSIIAYIVSKTIKINIPFDIVQSLMATSLLGLGYLSKNINYKINNIYTYFILFIIQITSSIFNTVRVDMASATYGNYFLFIISIVTSIILITEISKNYNNKFIAFCGKHSMFFFLWHQLVFNIYNKTRYYININFNYNIEIIIQFIVTVLTLTIYIYIIENYKKSIQKYN